jgi:hypothetical protein
MGLVAPQSDRVGVMTSGLSSSWSRTVSIRVSASAGRCRACCHSSSSSCPRRSPLERLSACQAARRYSWTRPPRTSTGWTGPAGPAGAGPGMGAWSWIPLCGRASLYPTYADRTRSRCRRFQMSTQSRHSVRAVRTNRSAYAFATGLVGLGRVARMRCDGGAGWTSWRTSASCSGGRASLSASPSACRCCAEQADVREVAQGHGQTLQQPGEVEAFLRAQFADQPTLVGDMFGKDRLD